MPDITLPRITSGFATVEAINAALTQLEDALNEALSREGGVPNQMNANLDMNSRRILNCPPAASNTEPVTLGQLRDMSEVVLYEPNPHTHPWEHVTGKPTTYLPAPHGHLTSDIVNLSPILTSYSTRITDLETRVRVYTQNDAPTSASVGDLWVF